KALSFRFIETPLLRKAAAMHYTSRQEQIEAEEAGATSKPVVLPLNIDTTQFDRLPAPDIFLKRFPQAVGRPIVLFLSRLDPKKGFALLLPAFANNLNRNPNPSLALAGDGDPAYVAALRARAAELHLQDDILWTGFLDGPDKLSAMSAATLFVLPSYS